MDDFLDQRQQVRIRELPPRQVDGQRQFVFWEAPAPIRKLSASRLEDPCTDGHDQTCVLRNRDEGSGTHQLIVVPPADQSLESFELTCR